MKSRMKTLSIASLLIFCAVAFTGCSYWYKHKSPEEKAAWIVEEIQEEFELNDVQMVNLNSLKDEILAIRKTFKDSHDKHHADALSLLDQPTLDQVKLQSMIDAKLDYMSKKSPAIVQSLAVFYDSLTAEQQAKLKKEWLEKSKRHHRYMH